jgi:hypothetical protein
VHYYLLDNGVLTNLAPGRRSERDIVAVISVDDDTPIERSHMRQDDVNCAFQDMRHQGRSVTFDELVTLLRSAEFIENDCVRPVPLNRS